MKVKDYDELPLIYQEILDAINTSEYELVFEKLEQIKEPIDFWYYRCHYDSYYLSNPLYFLINPHFNKEHYELIFEKFSPNLFNESIISLSENDRNKIIDKCRIENKKTPYTFESTYSKHEDALEKIILSIIQLNDYRFKNIYRKSMSEIKNSVFDFIEKVIENKLVEPSFKLIKTILDPYNTPKIFANSNGFSSKDLIDILNVLTRNSEKLKESTQYAIFSFIEYSYLNKEIPDKFKDLMDYYIQDGFVPELKSIPKNKDTDSCCNNYFDFIVENNIFEKINKILDSGELFEYSPYTFGILMKKYIGEKKKENRIVFKRALDYMLEKGINIDFKHKYCGYSAPQSIDEYYYRNIQTHYSKNKTEKARQNEMIMFYKENKLLLGKNYILNNLSVEKESEPVVVNKKRI